VNTDITRFAAEPHAPDLLINPLHDQGLDTLRGSRAADIGIRIMLGQALKSEIENTELIFDPLDRERTPDRDWLIDRFEDATGGLHPGDPAISIIDTPENLATTLGIDADGVNRQLETFYRRTGMRRRDIPGNSAENINSQSLGGRINKFTGDIRLSRNGGSIRNLLHELGHGSMHLLGLETSVQSDAEGRLQGSIHLASGGLTYLTEEGFRGHIVEEAVADGI
jgi:hypothetical protein